VHFAGKRGMRDLFATALSGRAGATLLIPGNRLVILPAVRNIQISIAPNNEVFFRDPGPGANLNVKRRRIKTTIKIVALVERDTKNGGGNA
jgi:hypothetical protein